MQKGKIIEVGNHSTLLQNYPDGTYAKFVKEQEQSEERNGEASGQVQLDAEVFTEESSKFNEALKEEQDLK